MQRKGRLFLFSLALALAACGQQAGNGEPPEGERVASRDEFQTRVGTPIDPETHPGKALWTENCATCHEGGVPKAPSPVFIEMMSPDAVLASMDGGIMSEQAAHLTQEEREQIAEYLARVELASYEPPAPPPRCESPVLAGGDPPARVGWGHDNRRFVPASVGGLSADEAEDLELKWAFAYPGGVRARSQPAIGWGTVFVGSFDGNVYALDLEEGCTRWTSRVSAEVRTAIVADPEEERLYFGDILGRAYAMDANTGELLWQRKLDDHPNATVTGSPALGDELLYVPVSSLEVTAAADPNYACCTFRGAVVALDPRTGEEVFKTFSIPEPPSKVGETEVGTDILAPSGAPVWNSPTYDRKRGLIYFGTGTSYSSPADGNGDAVIAVDAKTGQRRWTAQLTKGDAWNVGCMMDNANCPVEEGPDLDVGASPLLISFGSGDDIIVAGQKSGVAHGIDPETGEILWQTRLGHGGTQGGVHFGMAAHNRLVYVPINDMADTKDGRTYDASIRGSGIHAIDARDGRIFWRNVAENKCGALANCDPGISSAVTAIPGGVIAGHLDGMLRIYSTKGGNVLWEYDTKQQVRTVSGDMASGGGMSGPGPAVANGHLVVNSGYGLYYHMPGNVLLVFAPRR